ncbi:MAG: hypothetical protein K0S41_3072 [Anaerocolumna sp.]|nr:hypothetical protein [Anaerocolumna sp.]
MDRLAKGIFEYEKPNIVLSQEEIQITAYAGKTYTDSFTIRNSANTPIKGLLFSTNEQLQLKQTKFMDTLNTIEFCFHAVNMNPGENASGDICVVSDCGEIQIPFYVVVETPFIPSSIGKIKDLFNFTNLVKEDPVEAIKLFKSKEFIDVILKYETKYIPLYQSLLKSRSTIQGMDEFLIAIKKKLRVNISVEKTSLTYEVHKESFMDKVMLTKDNWGHAELHISTDAAFINLEKKIIWSDNFALNTYPLEFVLNPEQMRYGNNYGKIYITTAHQILVVEITCNRSKTNEEHYNQRSIQNYQYRLCDNYLSFRRNAISIDEYVNNANDILDNLSILDIKEKETYYLSKIHLLIISGKEVDAGKLLEEYKIKAEVIKFTDAIAYSGYLYLLALHNKNDISIEIAVQSIRDLFEKYNDYRLLWILLYLDKRYEKNKSLRLFDIKKKFLEGCHSPILYYEAATIYNEDPSLLHEISKFELQIVNWSIRNHYLSREAAMQFSYLANKQKAFDGLLHKCLVGIYETYELNEALVSICSLLIKGHQRGTRYFKWFSLGVENQLRITELHEYYMYSIDEANITELPQQILLYFIYNSNLSDRKKALLYSYIIKQKDNEPTIYGTYYKKIEAFAMKQLEIHNINRYLSTIYEDIIIQNGMDQQIAINLPFVMFRYELECKNSNIKGVYVTHKEKLSENYSTLQNGLAQIDIYTEDAEIILVDNQDNRYSASIEYTLHKLMHWEDYIALLLPINSSHPMLVLNLFDKAISYQKFDQDSLSFRKGILEFEDINTVIKNQNILDLIFYYYDNFAGELSETYLTKIDLLEINGTDRKKVIELFILSDMYDMAWNSVKRYGFVGIGLSQLTKLCTFLIHKLDSEDENFNLLIQLAFYIFKAGKYNEDILKILLNHFTGTTVEMFELWKVANSFELEILKFEERLLAQMLFAESYLVNSLSVFIHYYKHGTSNKIIKAFLSFYAFKYVIFDQVIQPELFDLMKKEIAFEENEVCMLALLKSYANKDNLTENELDFIDYNVHKYINKGFFLPFFTNFSKYIVLPARLVDKYYIEYITNPKHKVTIHYRLESKNSDIEFTSELMKNVYHGIHMKEFILFYNESIQYYITEEDEEEQTTITESVSVQLDQEMMLDEDTRYNHINFMLTAMDMQDDKSLVDSMSNYIKTSYTIKKLFKPL